MILDLPPAVVSISAPAIIRPASAEFLNADLALARLGLPRDVRRAIAGELRRLVNGGVGRKHWRLACADLAAFGGIEQSALERATFPFPFFCPKASAVVAIAAHTDTRNADAAWTDWTGAAFGTASSDRVMLFWLALRAAGTVTGTGCTIGGQTATLIAAAAATSGNTTRVEIWAALVPTGTTGTVAMTFSGATARYGCGINPMTGTGGNANYEYRLQVSAGISGSLQHSSNSGVLAVAVEQNNSNNFSWSSGATVDVSANQAGGPMAFSNAINNPAGAATDTVTASITGASATNEAMVAASFAHG